MGRSHDISRNGVFLDFPPNAVAKRTVITCIDRSKDYSPSPAYTDENLVSNIVELGPDDVDILQPITVSLMHSGPGRDLGYETIVRAFNKEKGVWAKIEELKDKSHLLKDCECDYIQVQISKLTALAVVTRLITDRFQVTPKGCVVRSSVCQDVTVEFPEGAVDKTVEGTMKLMLMPENIHQDACPILCVDGFSNITLSKPVIVKMPIPNNAAGYSTKEIRLLRLREDSKWEDNEWEDVTHQADISENKTNIEFHVQCFSRLWLWMSKKKIKFASTIFRHLRSPPRAVCFAAFNDNEEASLSVSKLTLVCVANHKQEKTLNDMRGYGYSILAVDTGDRKMRPDDKAYPSVNGAEMRTERFFLKFLGNHVCRKELSVCDTLQDVENLEQVVINFFPNPEENLNVNLRLGTLQMNKKKVFSRSVGERPSGEAHQQEVEEQAQSLEVNNKIRFQDKQFMVAVLVAVAGCILYGRTPHYGPAALVISVVIGAFLIYVIYWAYMKCSQPSNNFALGFRHEVSVSVLEETLRLMKHSVGAIIARNVSNVKKCGATCFRIGTEYVIINNHVVLDIVNQGYSWRDCYVDFNYKEQGPQPAEWYRFRFALNPVLFFSEELDYAILRLNPEGRSLPPSVIGPETGFNIAPPGLQFQGGECLTFIGHPGELPKQINVSCPIKPNETREAQVRNPNSAFYDVSTFFEGSSGSPGFLMKEKLLSVLHRRGDGASEEGTLMASVVEDVILKIDNGTIQNVQLDEIFNGLTSSTFDRRSPEPMDID